MRERSAAMCGDVLVNAHRSPPPIAVFALLLHDDVEGELSKESIADPASLAAVICQRGRVGDAFFDEVPLYNIMGDGKDGNRRRAAVMMMIVMMMMAMLGMMMTAMMMMMMMLAIVGMIVMMVMMMMKMTIVGMITIIIIILC